MSTTQLPSVTARTGPTSNPGRPLASSPRIYPLRLAPIDDFFLLDDRPTHPMTFTSHLYFTGDVCRDAFTEALEAALLRHPLLIALVKPLKGNRENGAIIALKWPDGIE